MEGLSELFEVTIMLAPSELVFSMDCPGISSRYVCLGGAEMGRRGEGGVCRNAGVVLRPTDIKQSLRGKSHNQANAPTPFFSRESLTACITVKGRRIYRVLGL